MHIRIQRCGASGHHHAQIGAGVVWCRDGATGLAANNGNYDTSLSFDGNYLYYTQGRSGSADVLYQINTTTGAARSLGSTGVTGIAGSALVNGRLELYQYGQSRNYVYSAPILSTSFTRGARLSDQIIVGGTTESTLTQANQLSSSVQLGGTVPEPPVALMLSSGLALIIFQCRSGKRLQRPPPTTGRP